MSVREESRDLLECWKLYPSWNPRQVPADFPPLISAKGWGFLPSSSHPAMAHLCLFSPFSLLPPSYVPQGAPRTNIPSKRYCLWVRSSPSLSIWGGGDCVGLVPGTFPALGTQQAPTRHGKRRMQHSRAYPEQPRGHPVTPLSVHTQYSMLTHA